METSMDVTYKVRTLLKQMSGTEVVLHLSRRGYDPDGIIRALKICRVPVIVRPGGADSVILHIGPRPVLNPGLSEFIAMLSDNRSPFPSIRVKRVEDDHGVAILTISED